MNIKIIAAGNNNSGSNTFLAGLTGGVTGVVVEPFRGAQRSGFGGFVGGVVRGVSGVFTKPTSGALISVSNASARLEAMLRRDDGTSVPLDPPQHCRNLDVEVIEDTVALSPKPLTVLLGGRHSLAAGDVSLAGTATASGAASSDPIVSLMTLEQFKHFSAEQQKQQQQDQIKTQQQQGDKRSLLEAVGVHNYALYAPWSDFVQYTTAEEFAEWAHLAKDAAVAAQGATPATAKTAPTPLSSATVASTSAATVMPSLPPPSAAALERAMHLKQSLGIRNMLKYVTLEQFVRVVSWSEAVATLPAEEFKGRVAACYLQCHGSDLRRDMFL